MIRKFVETPEFRRACRKYNISDKRIHLLQQELLSNPRKGDLVIGSGGTRKIRVKSDFRGKSSSYRIFYTDFSSYGSTFFWTVLDKKEATNITVEESKYIKWMNEKIKEELRARAL